MGAATHHLQGFLVHTVKARDDILDLDGLLLHFGGQEQARHRHRLGTARSEHAPRGRGGRNNTYKPFLIMKAVEHEEAMEVDGRGGHDLAIEPAGQQMLRKR